MSTINPIEHFWDNIEINKSCWMWKGAKTGNGYGVIYIKDKSRMSTHRFSYILYKGRIKPNLVIDHLCRTPLCVNPHHLEAVTNKENILRGVGTGAINSKKSYCKR